MAPFVYQFGWAVVPSCWVKDESRYRCEGICLKMAFTLQSADLENSRLPCVRWADSTQTNWRPKAWGFPKKKFSLKIATKNLEYPACLPCPENFGLKTATSPLTRISSLLGGPEDVGLVSPTLSWASFLTSIALSLSPPLHHPPSTSEFSLSILNKIEVLKSKIHYHLQYRKNKIFINLAK